MVLITSKQSVCHRNGMVSPLLCTPTRSPSFAGKKLLVALLQEQQQLFARHQQCFSLLQKLLAVLEKQYSVFKQLVTGSHQSRAFLIVTLLHVSFSPYLLSPPTTSQSILSLVAAQRKPVTGV